MRCARYLTLLAILFAIGGYRPAFSAQTDPGDSKETSRPITFGVETDTFSRYVWHGVISSTGAVSQSSAYIEAYGFGASVWTNQILDKPSQGDINEIDYMAYYSGEFMGLEIEPAITAYSYPRIDDAPTTFEVSLHLGYTLGPIEIFNDTSVDVDEYSGATYSEIGVGFSRTLSPKFSLHTQVALGIGNATFNRAYLADVGTQANTISTSTQLRYTPWQGLFVTPTIATSILLPDALRATTNDPSLVWGGVQLGYDF